MPTLFTVKLDPNSDNEILFATRASREAGGFGVEDEIVKKGVDTVQNALEMIKTIGRCAATKLHDFGAELTEATVGLKLTGTGKFVVAEAAAEAALEVKFVFRNAIVPSSNVLSQP